MRVGYKRCSTAELNETRRLKMVKEQKGYFGINQLLLQGDSILNGAFRRTGVIDEVSLVAAPFIAVSPGQALVSGSPDRTLQLSGCPYRNDTLWLNYRRISK